MDIWLAREVRVTTRRRGWRVQSCKCNRIAQPPRLAPQLVALLGRRTRSALLRGKSLSRCRCIEMLLRCYCGRLRGPGPAEVNYSKALELAVSRRRRPRIFEGVFDCRARASGTPARRSPSFAAQARSTGTGTPASSKVPARQFGAHSRRVCGTASLYVMLCT
ncbi:hypothetical protein FA95DRAFT_1276542 [Auriscalpium vulgare]|uniref:Uncharacterized protein n=1 Tax=Auriscalpium vulgare TaxID=40419 RepID=A0ACB8RTF8_9AGAM|nr:hypothetical protein FA95DRAFT_1276542 [Auriscalpium vulgare]